MGFTGVPALAPSMANFPTIRQIQRGPSPLAFLVTRDTALFSIGLCCQYRAVPGSEQNLGDRKHIFWRLRRGGTVLGMPQHTSMRNSKVSLRLGMAAFLIPLLAVPSVRHDSSLPIPHQSQDADEIHQLWSAAIEPMLPRAVQSPNEAYTDGQELMVPLHAAFHLRDDAWERGFADHFFRLASNPSVLPAVVLSRLEYLYLASEFLVLAQQNDRQDLIPPGLPDLLFSNVQNYWRVAPAWQWGQKPFSGGIRERILWKLKNHKVEKSYYRAIVDDDLFLLAIAADLRTFGGTPEQKQAWNST